MKWNDCESASGTGAPRKSHQSVCVRAGSPSATPETVSVDPHADAHEIISISSRRDPLTMGLLWITMVTCFPCVLQGFIWYKLGLNLLQVLVCTVISMGLMMVYALPSAHIGSSTGHSYGTLVKTVFGRTGKKLVAVNLLWMFVAWYGLSSLFLAEGLEGLFHIDLPLVWVAPALAVIMAFNNFWGFKGVANFARYFAAPMLIIWVGYTLFKTISLCPASIITEPGTCTFPVALTIVANFIIGICVWGNEADYWRHGKPTLGASAWPLAIAMLVGQVIFPTTGWLVGRMTGITDYSQATSYMNDYSFGGIALFGALVISASFFAANDSNLYGSTNALQQLVKLPHRIAVAILTVFGAAVAALLSGTGCAQALEKVASLNCVVMAMPTVFITVEFFLIRKFLSVETDLSRVPSDDELPGIRIPALVALIVGCIVGIGTSGVIPGTGALHFGICSLQGWFAGLAVYVPMRWWEHRMEVADRALLTESANLLDVGTSGAAENVQLVQKESA